MKQKSKKYVDEEGTVEWKLPNGRLHRLDGPAAEWNDGTKEWFVNGKRHRLDGPAVEWADGTKTWYVNDKLHRLDGPAIERSDGHKEWWVDGKRHRLDGPAIEYASGGKAWCVDDTCYTTFQSYLEDVKLLITEQEYFILLLTYGTEE